MQKILFAMLLLAIIGGGVWFGMKREPETKPAMPRKTTGDNVVKTTPDTPENDKPRPQSKYYVKPEMVPVHWEGFYELSQFQTLNRVTKEMHNKELMDPELYEFLKAEMFNRNHWDVTRNNIANALVWTRNDQNRHPDPDLHEAFITMLEDETEDPVWRDYCLQFLSENLQNSSDPKRVMGVITTFSKGDDSIAGTALVHMALQERDGGVTLDDDFGDQLAEKLEKPEVHRDTKLAIIGVMGTRKDVKQLPIIRKYAKQNENAGLKRVAIAALGTIGASAETKDSITDEDKALIKAALTNKNRAVKMAAEAALKRLEKS